MSQTREKTRYDMLRDAGFNSKDATKYKYHKDETVLKLVKQKKRYDKLLPWLDYDKDCAWQMSSSYTDEDIDLLVVQLASQLSTSKLKGDH